MLSRGGLVSHPVCIPASYPGFLVYSPNLKVSEDELMNE